MAETGDMDPSQAADVSHMVDDLRESIRREEEKAEFVPGTLHVLFAEDDRVTGLVVKSQMEKAGYICTHVTDGELARQTLDEAEEGTFDIVVTDVVMPGLTGIDLLKWVRGDERFDMVPVIVVSSLSNLNLGYTCLAMQADDFYTKPLSDVIVKRLWVHAWKRKQNWHARSKQGETPIEAGAVPKIVTNADDDGQHRGRPDSGMLLNTIEALQERISAAVDTPISAAVEHIQGLMASPSMSDEVRATLSTVLETLGGTQEYQEAFESVVMQSVMDTNTKEFILDHLGRNTQQRRGSLVDTLSMPTLARSRSHSGSDNGEPEETTTPRGSPVLGAPESASQPSSAERLAALTTLDTTEMLSMGDAALIPYLIDMLLAVGTTEILRIRTPVLRAFVERVAANYKLNPYHNFKHAFDVTQFVFWLLTVAGADALLTPLDAVALMLAAICHDVRHPGLNNNFQILTMSELARLYNDQSVLENHHSATVFELAQDSDCNVFAGLNREEMVHVRRFIIKPVLATDLALHVGIMAEFDEAITNGYDPDDVEHRLLLCQMLLKCADISNPLRPFPLSRYWSDRIIEESLNQGRKEKQLGLPPSPFQDPDKVNQAKQSLAFSNFFVQPSVAMLTKVLPDLEHLALAPLEANRRIWAERVEAENAAEAATHGE